MTRKRKAKAPEDDEKLEEANVLPAVVSSDNLEPVSKKGKWTNKERVLIFCSRGIGHRDRHLMRDLLTLLPHSKPDVKMQKSEKLIEINEIADMKNCNKVLYFENRKREDLYMWASNAPEGPSAKFLVENVHTMNELKLTGNCLRGSRPLLSFDKSFDESPQYSVLKEMFIQIFSTPNNHPKSQPFVDNVYTFSVIDNRIWFRNYQIVEENGAMAEIGPRFVLNPIKVFNGSFGGGILWTNPHFTSPNLYRRMMRKAVSEKYRAKNLNREKLEERKTKLGPTYNTDVTDDVFVTIDSETVKSLD